MIIKWSIWKYRHSLKSCDEIYKSNKLKLIKLIKLKWFRYHVRNVQTFIKFIYTVIYLFLLLFENIINILQYFINKYKFGFNIHFTNYYLISYTCYSFLKKLIVLQIMSYVH